MRINPIIGIIANIPINIPIPHREADGISLQEAADLRGIDPVAVIIEADLRKLFAVGEQEPIIET